jgi:ferrous iron transport protein B
MGVIPAGAEAAEKVRRIAVAGNPNCGKTTLFNALTGLRQRVGNYPGVTVERKEGRFFGSHGEALALLDLPGCYSLQAHSPDEAVSRDVLLGRRPDEPRPDAVVAVLDASNLERNLYLVAQLIELELPLVLALNMADVAEANGVVIDVPELSRRLGVPVVPMVASEGKGIVELRQAVSAATGRAPAVRAPMPGPIEAEIGPLAARIGGPCGYAEALLLLSLHDRAAVEKAAGAEIAPLVLAARERIERAGLDPAGAPVEARYEWIQRLCDGTVRRPGEVSLSVSDHLDAWFTHKIWGWVAFLGAMALMFFCIFTVAAYPMDWIDAGFGALADWIKGNVPDGRFQSLLSDGIVAGVGGVVIFLPQILVLFFFLGVLEDSGYMARAAFIMDRVMARVGLHGKSFIPLLSSFACAIPGIMAARTIEQPKDRLATILVAPLMSCSARLPVYTLMIAVLMPAAGAWQKAGIILAMYMVGLLAAFGMAWLFKRTLLRGETPMLLLELPPYRRPQLRSIAMRMLERAQLFLRRAGTVILALSILLWALVTFPSPRDPEATSAEAVRQSFAGQIGRALEPAIAPLGYDWRIGIGLVGSFAAREVFVSTMGIVYNVESDDDEATRLQEVMRGAQRDEGGRVFTPLVCVGLMVFYVLAMQCISTVAIVRRETNSWKWPLFQIGYMTFLAWLGAFAVYQGGRLFGWQ